MLPNVIDKTNKHITVKQESKLFCNCKDNTIYHLLSKGKQYWDKTLIQKILKVNLKLKPEVFFLGLLDKMLESYFKC